MRGTRKVVVLSLLTLMLSAPVAVAAGSAPERTSNATRPVKPKPTSDACGALLLKSDGSTWACSFVDDFTGTRLDTKKWVAQTDFYTGSPGGLACYMDDPANVAVANGALRLTLRPVSSPVECLGESANYTSGQVSTFYKFSQKYGRFEARMKVTASQQPGLHEAFWLWPDARVASSETWPAAGEIDIVETYSQYPDLAVPFLHYTSDDNGGPTAGLNTAWDCAATRGVWNTYTLLWEPDRIEVQVNGVTCLVNTSGDVAFQKAYILILSQAMGTGTNAFTGTATLPATTEVDYVRVWR